MSIETTSEQLTRSSEQFNRCVILDDKPWRWGEAFDANKGPKAEPYSEHAQEHLLTLIAVSSVPLYVVNAISTPKVVRNMQTRKPTSKAKPN